MGMAIQMNTTYRQRIDFENALIRLKGEIDAAVTESGESNLILKKILVNVRKLVQRITEVSEYFEKETPTKNKKTTLDHSHFVTHQPLDPKILFNNMSLESSVFKHSLRVAIASVVGYIIVNLLHYGHYSYWVLMTIVFMLKPAFSLTKQRNIERIIGTFIGGIIGVLILLFIHNTHVLFALMVLFMIINYSMVRINYLIMVVSLTPFVLILFSLLGVGAFDVAKERILDTVLGCSISFVASYFLFPTWESEQLEQHLRNMVKANSDYLKKIIDGLNGKPISLLEYKLVRKEVYVSSANLAAAFQRMLSEPKSKQKNSKLMHQFVVLNHILFSNIATVVISLLNKEPRVHPPQLVQSAKKSLSLLQDTGKKLGEDIPEEAELYTETPLGSTELTNTDDLLLKDQLDFIQRLNIDLDKTTTALISG
jgi:uncharacterized membrane protein YccC